MEERDGARQACFLTQFPPVATLITPKREPPVAKSCFDCVGRCVMAMTVDSSKCSGCRACQMICALHRFRELNPKKGALQIVPKFPAPGGYQVNFCDQCGVCNDVCPAHAISV